MLEVSRELFYAAAASAAALVGAHQDLQSRRVPNLLTGSSLVIGLAIHLLLGGVRGLGSSALAGLAAGTVLLLMYFAGGMGAGDVKLIAAVGCLAGLPALSAILIGTVISGAILGIAIALHQHRLKQVLGGTLSLMGSQADHRAEDDDQALSGAGQEQRLSMPYAVAIALGCLLALGEQIWKG